MAFDLRFVIGTLFSLMGSVLLVASLTVNGTVAGGVSGAVVDLSTGVIMLTFGALMIYAGKRRK